MSEQEKRQMKIKCPSCSSKLDVTELAPFTVFPCPRCGYEVTVPMRFLSYVLEEYLESSNGVQRYRALEATLDREAYVVMCEASDSHPWKQLERYLDFVKKIAAISHPGLATVYSCGRYETGVYVAFQLVREPIGKLSSGMRMEWREARPLLLALAEALQKAAEEGVAHGALCEQSFRLDDTGVPKVCDFGEGVLLTGKLSDDPFASPERKAGGECEVVGDIFSFGVWAYKLLTGHAPFDKSGNAIDDEAADVPKGVLAILRQMASASPFQRPDGYLNLLAELRKDNHVAPLKTRRKDVGTVAGEQLPVPRTGGMAASILLVLLVMAVGAAGGWWCWKYLEQKELAESEKPQAIQTAEVSPGRDADDKKTAGGKTSDDVASSGETASAKSIRLPAKFIKLRPRPDDLIFDEDDVKEYLDKLPEEYMPLEKERLDRIKGLRDYIFASLRMPYRPEKGEGLRLRDGSLVKGFIPMGTEAAGLTVRPLDSLHQNLTVETLKLEELEWGEIWRMLDYYGKMREDLADAKASGLFDHYLNSALACDWYGYRKEAVAFAKKALKASPAEKSLVEKFGFK